MKFTETLVSYRTEARWKLFSPGVVPPL